MFCSVSLPKTLPNSLKNHQKIIQKSFQNEPKSIQNHSQKGFQQGSSKIHAFCLLFTASWAPPGRLWRRFGDQKRPKLDAKTAKNRCRNACKIKGHFKLDFFQILTTLGRQNGAQMGSKSHQKRRSCWKLGKPWKPYNSMCFSMIFMVSDIGKSTKIQ